MSDVFYRKYDELCFHTEKLYELVNSAGRHFLHLLKQGPSESRGIVTGKEEAVHQIEATVKSRMERMLESDLPVVQIHTGGMTQELLRQEGATALATNRDIYIREEAYQEGTAETDAILLHEFTHILQMERRERLSSSEERAEAEKEAEQSERLAYPERKNYYYAEIGGELFCMNKQSEKEAIEYAVKLVQEMIDEAVAKGDIELLVKIQQALRSEI